jgi:hypothetical protein
MKGGHTRSQQKATEVGSHPPCHRSPEADVYVWDAAKAPAALRKLFFTLPKDSSIVALSPGLAQAIDPTVEAELLAQCGKKLLLRVPMDDGGTALLFGP